MKPYIPIVLISTFASIASCSGSGARNTADEKAEYSATETLRARLAAMQESGTVMFGHHDDPVYGHNWCGDSGRSDVLEVCGHYPAVMSWDLGGLETGDSLNLDGVPFDRIRREVIAQDARGGINTFSWHLRNAVDGGDSWSVSDSTIVGRMVNDSVSMNAFKAQLAAVAKFFNSLSDKEGNKIGVIFRPWHEHTGGWFWWGAPLCSIDDYKKMWQITRSELDSLGVDNVLYAYSPDRVADIDQYMERYPGDEYVDIVGADIYHFGGLEGTDNYRNDASRVLSIVRQVADSHNKIPAFTETGCESLTVENWWTEVLLPVLKENPMSYVVVWRNAHDKPNHFYAPYPGHPSAESFKAFSNDSLITFIK